MSPPACLHPPRRALDARERELELTRILISVRSLLGSIFTVTPTFIAVAMLGMHTLLGHRLDLQKAMYVLATVNLLRSPLVFVPLILTSAQEAGASTQVRIIQV